MKKIFTLIAAALMAVSANAAKTEINLTGLTLTDFTFTKGEYTATEEDGVVTINYVKGSNTWCTLGVKGVPFKYKNSSTKNAFFVAKADYFTVGGKGVEMQIGDVTKGQKITLNVAKKDDPNPEASKDTEKTRQPGFAATGAQLESNGLADDTGKGVFADVVFTVSTDGTAVIKNNDNAYLIKSITIEDGEFILKDGTYFIQYPGTEANAFTDGNGFKLQITGNTEKKYGKGDKFTIDGTTYQSIKGSNGAENTLTLPEGKVTSSITLYSVINADALGENPSFWQEVAGTKFKGDQEGEAFTTLKGSATSYDERTYNFKNGKLNTITFTNKNLQPYFLIKVTIETGTPVTPEAVEFVSTSGIETLKAAKAAKDGAIYNLAGQKVSKDFKGLVIKNGVKVINK